MLSVDDAPSAGAWADTLTIIGGMIFSGILPFAILSLFFGVFISTLPLFSVAAVLLVLLLLSALMLLFGGLARRVVERPSATTSRLQSFNALPKNTQERFYEATGEDHRPPTLMYGVTLAGDATKIIAIAYGVTLAYIAFGVLGVGLAAVVSGFVAARDHAQLDAAVEAHKPVADGDIVDIVNEYSEQLGITTPPACEASLQTGPAAAIRTDEENACILLNTERLSEYEQKEKEAVIVHELAHIKQGISSRRPIALRPIPLLITLAVSLLFTPPVLVVPILTFAGYTVIKLHLMRQHRHFERQADKTAADLVGPIPTAIALVRASDVAPLSLADNNLVQLAEQFSSHPQTAARIDTLISDVSVTQEKGAPLPQPIPDWEWQTEETEA